MVSVRKSSSGMASSLSCWPISVVRTPAGTSSITWTPVPAACTRRLSLKECSAALVAL